MKTLYLEAEKCEKKIVRLYENGQLLAEKITAGDLLLALEELLREKKVVLREIKKIEVAPQIVNSASGRVALSIAQALRYALGL